MLSALERYTALAAKRISSLPPGLTQPTPGRFDRIVIALSSGVDSSTCAALYASHPHAELVYMRNWNHNQGDAPPERCDEQDWKDAQCVAAHVNLPLRQLNFEREYWQDVFEAMLAGYERGATPNPDVLCNRHVKFGALRAQLDAEYGAGNYWLVTGHYARVLQKESRTSLLHAVDTHKDQSYYLAQVKRGALARTLLPLGHLLKPEVRALAQELELPTAAKRDSQGICFVENSQGAGRFRDFLQEYLPPTPGAIVTPDGKRWATHEGLWTHTLGQRVGGGLSLPQGSPEYRGTWYVAEKRVQENELVIVRGRDNPALYRESVAVRSFEPLGLDRAQFAERISTALAGGTLYMQYRSLQTPAQVLKCTVDNNTTDNDVSIKLTMAEPQRAMAVGQYCCLYDGEEVLGSGPISATAGGPEPAM